MTPLCDLLGATTVNGGHPGSSAISSSTELDDAIGEFLHGQSGASILPKAYVNWVLLDERFNLVGSSSGFQQVGSPESGDGCDGGCPAGGYETHTREDMPVEKSGYLYIYVSNVTPNIPVYFDNLQVTHIRGPLLEENHYYPFGLIQQGISSKALSFGGPENKLKYNSIEKEDAFEIGIYDAQLRELDGQIGRWWQMDPKIENMEMWSPYASNYDNPIRFMDMLGDEPGGCCGFFSDIVDGFVGKAKSTWHAVTHPKETVRQMFSKEALKDNFLNAVTFGAYGDVKTLTNEGPANFIGGKAFDVAAFVVSDGISKGVKGKVDVKTPEIKTELKEGAKVTEAYKRPNNATTAAQRAAVQGKPCVTCGESSPKMVADHKTPLVKEHYETGTIDKEKMKSTDAVQPQCPTCSAKQGAEMSQYSKQQKQKNGL